MKSRLFSSKLFFSCLLIISVAVMIIGITFRNCEKKDKDYVAEQINEWNEQGMIPTDSFAFAWFECRGWHRFDSIMKLPLNVDRDSIIADIDMGGPCWSSEEIISEGVVFDGGGVYTYFLCDVPDGVIIIISDFIARFVAMDGRKKKNDLTLTYKIQGEEELHIEQYILDYTVAPYIIGRHAYGFVQERFDYVCYRDDDTWDN